MAEEYELPIFEIWKGVGIYDLQPPERIAEARRQIDEVIRMRSGDRLAAFAADATRSPEARRLAKCKAMETLQERQRRTFDIERLEAATLGISRRETAMARLIGSYQAEWWPAAWLPR
jgi:hypothetical protein